MKGEWLGLTANEAKKRYITCMDLTKYDDWLPQLNTIRFQAIMQQLHATGHKKEFAEFFDRVNGFNNLEIRNRVCPYMTVYIMNEYSDIPEAVRGATSKEVEFVCDSYPENICNFIPVVRAQDIGQHLLYKTMGVHYSICNGPLPECVLPYTCSPVWWYRHAQRSGIRAHTRENDPTWS